MEKIRRIVVRLAFLLVASLTVSGQGPLTKIAPTVFMGHTLGETIQQWLEVNHNPDMCTKAQPKLQDKKNCARIAASNDSEPIILYSLKQELPHYTVPEDLQADDATYNYVWYFEKASLVMMLSDGNYQQVLDNLEERYGAPTSSKKYAIQNAFGATFDRTDYLWHMPDGTLITLQDWRDFTFQLGHLIISSQTYMETQKKAIDAKRRAANPF